MQLQSTMARDERDEDPDEIRARAEADAWLELHARALRDLRNHGRAWGASTWADDRPPTFTERARVDCSLHAGPPPSRVMLEAFAGDPVTPAHEEAVAIRWTLSEITAGSLWTQAVQSPDLWSRCAVILALTTLAARPSPHMLFRAAPASVAPIVREALKVVSPLELALAVRAWDPDLAVVTQAKYAGVLPTFHTTSQKELRQERGRAKAMRASLRHLRKAVACLPVDPEYSGDTWSGLVAVKKKASANPRVVLDSQIRRLERHAESIERWVASRARVSDAEANAIAAVRRRPTRTTKLSPTLERAVAEARLRWWGPVEAKLRAADPDGDAWDERRLAELLLADVWFVDLIPWTREKYRQDAGREKLRAVIRGARAPKRSIRSRRAARAQSAVPRRKVRRTTG